MTARLSTIAVAGLLLMAVALSGATPAGGLTVPHRYVIGGRSYYEISVKAAASLPGVPPDVKDAVRLLSACPGLDVHLFVRTNLSDGGLTATLPTDLRACVEEANGGPGAFSPCTAFYKPPNAGVYVAVVGTSNQTCFDMEFEVPGGPTFNDAGQSEVIKAQGYVNGSLVDYFAPSATVPVSRNEYQIDDSQLDRPFGRISSIPLRDF